MHRFMYPTRVVGAALALGLVASACGAESTPTLDAAPAADQTTESSADTASDATTAEEAEGPVADGAASDDDAASESDTGSDGEDAVGDHLFPDIDTVNIVDGSTLNLADELAGGDTPVLLWFWAPH